MRKSTKQSDARTVKTTRWAPGEWELVEQKAHDAGVTPSEYVRAKALNQPLMMARWRHRRPKAA